MEHAPQRTAFSGPALIRLLARLTDAEVSDPKQSLADRLSQWLAWTDAIKLSSALNGNPPATAAGAPANLGAAEKECARVRSALANAIANDSTFAAIRPRGAAMEPSAADDPVDSSVLRQRYLFLQREMETAIGHLRERLRVTLAAQTPGMAKLAMVDAVMERALAPREQSLLAALPRLMTTHFERLRRQAQQAPGDAQATEVTAKHAPCPWLDTFRKDMQSVLLAEMEVRFQPVEGLLAALRTS
ncbi:DUF3348 domain-containing protein [Trinickia soli]|uniref:DUF3348 domain-containing protein n=1 Tax=Trinickia soli TaxID=380675 RepID=A0A2N7VV38_9BURK|nr:DUF3348 domain-containing protein [Trinickia soli]PMS21025.1 DUF3348 domain-containing protein [Trinickia soli]CAB3666088.1 hypothetical protein LMG24076_01704 [Trinickia soli]